MIEVPLQNGDVFKCFQEICWTISSQRQLNLSSRKTPLEPRQTSPTWLDSDAKKKKNCDFI